MSFNSEEHHTDAQGVAIKIADLLYGGNDTWSVSATEMVRNFDGTVMAAAALGRFILRKAPASMRAKLEAELRAVIEERISFAFNLDDDKKGL